jgi:hypothetical protein
MTSRGMTVAKKDKIERVLRLVPRSVLVSKVIPINRKEWAGIFAQLSDDDVDNILLLLEQEGKVFGGRPDWANDVEDVFPQEPIASNEYLDRLEELRIAMERLQFNVNGDA